MKIEHIAIWTTDLERLRRFYIKYFNATSNQKYSNPQKKFESYFLSFSQGCRIEIMSTPRLNDAANDKHLNSVGLAHLAVSVGAKAHVISLTEELRRDGYKVISEPRTTGDGYFESVIGDPDGNQIEITI